MSKEAEEWAQELAANEPDYEAEWVQRLGNITGVDGCECIDTPRDVYVTPCRVCSGAPSLYRNVCSEGSSVTTVYIYICNRCANYEGIPSAKEFSARRTWNVANGGAVVYLRKLSHQFDNLLRVVGTTTDLNNSYNQPPNATATGLVGVIEGMREELGWIKSALGSDYPSDSDNVKNVLKSLEFDANESVDAIKQVTAGLDSLVSEVKELCRILQNR